MASLPADVTKHALSFLVVAEIPRGAALCKAWAAAARAPDLWLALCEARWPSTVSGALRQAVLRRGPREYYRQHAAALRGYQPRPLLDLDDHLIQLELSQNGRTICSVARELRDVLRRDCEDIDHSEMRDSLRDGVMFDNLRARVDTSKGNEFPPREAPVSISCSVIRKSDARVAVLVPTTELEWTCGWSFGRGDRGEGNFASNPLLRGALPASYELPTLLDVDPHDVSTTWLLGRMSGTQRLLGTHVCKTVAAVHIGTLDEFPHDAKPWIPYSDPSVVAGEGYVELRRIFMTISLHLEERVDPENEELREDEGDSIRHDCLDLNPDELRLAFDQRLVFR